MAKNTECFEQINSELISFYGFCKENQLSNEDIAQICEPIFKMINKEKIKKRFEMCLIIVLVLFLLYVVLDRDAIWWHLSAIGRIFLIKILPIWDWTDLKNEKCLITGNVQIGETFFDCALCESVTTVDEIPLDDSTFHERIKLHRPVLLKTDINVNLIESIRKNDLLFNSFPCKLSSNLNNNDLITVGAMTEKTEKFESYFVHFQNCDFEIIKAFRSIVPRPFFLPDEVSPIQYSWVLISQNYSVKKYKKIDLVERIDVFMQFNGANHLRLIPRDTCESECEELMLKITEGEALVFTSMWNLEYKPEEVGRNVAVILEAH